MLSRASAQPTYRLRRQRERQLVFIEDHDPLGTLRSRLAEHAPDETLHVFLAPEGLVPRYYAQFPLSVKPGAFVLASKLADDFEGARPVYLVQNTSNGLEHLSGRNPSPFNVRVQEPVHVPPGDPKWIDRARTSFSALVDEQRGQRMVDLRRPGFVEGTSVPYSSFRTAP